MLSVFHKDRTTEHIDTLINLNSDYLKLINTRLKANNLFKEFDQRARQDFMNLIKLSQERYKSVKSGNTLDTILDNQKEIFGVMSDNVQKEDFYNNISAISDEKRKFLKIRNKLRNKELAIARAKIRETREEGIKTKIEDPNFNSNTNYMISKNNFSQSRKKSFKMISKHKFFSTNGENGEPDLNYILGPHDQQSNLDANKQYSDFIEEDMNKFERQMEEYYDHLNNLKLSFSNGENSKMIKIFTFLTDDINLLSYKPQIHSNVVKVSDTGNKLDIQKLMKFSKRYKHKIGKFRKNYIQVEDDVKLDTKSEFGKGISITKNEISNLKNLDEILNKKKNLLNKFFEENGMKIEYYKQISKNNFSSGKNLENYEEEKVYRTEESALNKNTTDLIKQDMIRTLEETKKEWHQDHIQQQKLEKLEKERRMLNINFLNEIDAKPKILQKFVDPYSTREDVSNRVLKKNQQLARNKKNLNEISTKIQASFYNKQNIEIQKNKEIIENLKRNIAIDEDEEEENSSIELGAKRKEMISDIFKSNHANQREKMERVYEEFQEYKKLIIEKEKSKLKKKGFDIEEETKKYLNMLEIENGVGSRSGIKKITPNKLLIKRNDVVDKTFKRGITSNHMTGYQISNHNVDIPFIQRQKNNTTDKESFKRQLTGIFKITNNIIK